MPLLTFMPDNRTIKVRHGISILEASRLAKLPLRTRCGGLASCLMCKIITASDSGLTKPQGNESRKLGSLIDQGYRLGCQTRVIGDATVTIPEDPLKAAVRAQLAKQQQEELW